MTRSAACMSLVAIAFGLSACDARDAAQPVPRGEVAPPATRPPAVAASESTPRYVGRWASEPANCAAGAWRFEARRLATAGEVSCDFDEVSATPGGYRISARCIAQAPPERQTFSLTFEGPPDAQRMTVAGGPWSGPISLVRCGD